MAKRKAQTNGPGQDADVVAFDQRIYRIVHHIEQQRAQHGAHTGWRHHVGSLAHQHQFGGEQEARGHSDQRRGQRTDRVKHDDRTNMRRLAVLVARERSGDQDEHQHRRDRLQRSHEQVAQQPHRLCRRRPQ